MWLQRPLHRLTPCAVLAQPSWIGIPIISCTLSKMLQQRVSKEKGYGNNDICYLPKTKVQRVNSRSYVEEEEEEVGGRESELLTPMKHFFNSARQLQIWHWRHKSFYVSLPPPFLGRLLKRKEWSRGGSFMISGLWGNGTLFITGFTRSGPALYDIRTVRGRNSVS